MKVVGMRADKESTGRRQQHGACCMVAGMPTTTSRRKAVQVCRRKAGIRGTAGQRAGSSMGRKEKGRQMEDPVPLVPLSPVPPSSSLAVVCRCHMPAHGMVEERCEEGQKACPNAQNV